LLARSQKGIQVSSVTAESMEEEDAAQAAAAASAQGTPQKVEKDESAQKTPAAESTTGDDAVEMTTPASAAADADNNSAAVDTPASSSPNPPVDVSDLDSILDSAVADTTPTAAADNSEEPTSEKKRESLRPLAARREKIMAAKKKAAAEAAAEGGGGGADEGEEEEEEEKFRFISKTAREVELEIAAQTKQNDDDVSGSNDRVLEKELSEKVLMGKDKGSTATSSSSSSGGSSSSKGGSSIKRRSTRTGAGASSPRVSSSSSPKDSSSSSSPSSSSSALSKEEKAKEMALERKIDILIQQQQAVDGAWLPKLLRVLMLVALAAYAGYCSYLESPEGVSVLVMKKEGEESGGFGRQFFDLSSLGMGPALHTIQAAAAGGGVIDEAAFDMATNSGLGGGSAGGHGLEYVPTFECSSAWSDTTSISFAVIMVLGTISDRLLKQKTPGKKEQEGLSGYLSWFWEMYGQGWEIVYDYAFGYVGEYCAYWVIIIAVSAGLSYASSVGSPLVPMHGGGELELSSEL
jgi:hypothetical protein